VLLVLVSPEEDSDLPFLEGPILETCLIEEKYETRKERQLSGSFKKGCICPHTAPRMYQRKTVDSIPLCCCSCHWQGNMLGCAVYVGSGEVWDTCVL